MKSSAALFSFLILLFISQLQITASGQTIQNNLRFGFVKNYKSYYQEAGDSIWLANTKKSNRVASKTIAFLRADGVGKINLNGRDIDLKMTKDYLPDKNFKVGRGGYQIWKGKNIVLRLDYIFTRLCQPKDEQCEVYYYRGTMVVNYKSKQRFSFLLT
jgi:hypothetical protein